MDLTVRWLPATARATLPHTSVEATTATASRVRRTAGAAAGQRRRADQAERPTAMATHGQPASGT